MPDAMPVTVFLAALAVLVTPGPAVLYIAARSVNQGRAAGIVSALGIGTGTLVHVAAAALGLSAVLVSSALAFSVLKYLGAGYLIYLGVRKLLAREEDEATFEVERKPLREIYYQGVVVNVLNPKSALFFFAFLPQFIDPARGPVMTQTLMLGALFVPLAFCTDSSYALLAGTAGEWVRRSRRLRQVQRYMTGTVYIGLGVATALVGAGKK